jgi:hypothetical protein
MPALLIEWERLPAGLGTVGLRMIVPPCEWQRRRPRTLLPKLLDRFLGAPVVQRREETASQCAGMPTRGQAFESGKLLPHLLRDRRRTAAGHDCKRAREQRQHALLREPTPDGASGVGGRVRGLRPVGWCAVSTQHQRTDQCRAPLELLPALEWQGRTVLPRCPRLSRSPCAPRTPSRACSAPAASAPRA